MKQNDIIQFKTENGGRLTVTEYRTSTGAEYRIMHGEQRIDLTSEDLEGLLRRLPIFLNMIEYLETVELLLGRFLRHPDLGPGAPLIEAAAKSLRIVLQKHEDAVNMMEVEQQDD